MMTQQVTPVLDLTQESQEDRMLFLNPEQPFRLILPAPAGEFLTTHHSALKMGPVSMDGDNYSYLCAAEDIYRGAQNLSYCFLAHLSTGGGQQVYVYQNKPGGDRRPTLTVVNPTDANLCMTPLGMLEIVVLDTSDRYMLPRVEAIGDGLPLQLIRREYVPKDDQCVRNPKDSFAIMRWKQRVGQYHFFFRVAPQHMPLLLRFSQRRLPSAKITFDALAEPTRTVVVDLMLRDAQRREVSDHLRSTVATRADYVLSESANYGLGGGLFYGHFLVSDRSEYIQILHDVREQVIEMPCPVQTESHEVPYGFRWKTSVRPNHQSFMGFSCEPLEDHIINRCVLQRFLLKDHSPRTPHGNGYQLLGFLELNSGSKHRRLPVYSVHEFGTVPHGMGGTHSVNSNFQSTRVAAVVSEKKPTVSKVDFDEIEGDIAENCMVMSVAGSHVNAVGSPSKKVSLYCPLDGTSVEMRTDQKLCIRMEIPKEGDSRPGLWDIVSAPTFLGSRSIRRMQTQEVFEIEISHWARTSNDYLPLVFQLKNGRQDLKVNILLKAVSTKAP